MLFLVFPHLVLSYLVLSCVSLLLLSCRVMSCLVMSYPPSPPIKQNQIKGFFSSCCSVNLNPFYLLHLFSPSTSSFYFLCFLRFLPSSYWLSRVVSPILYFFLSRSQSFVSSYFHFFSFVLFQYNTIQYNAIQYNAIQYNTIQHNAIQYNTIQYNTIQYNTIQYNTIQYNIVHNNTMQQKLRSNLITV